MDDGMTVGANGAQVIDGIDPVRFPNVGEWLQMVNVDQASPHLSIRLEEVKSTDHTACPIIVNARLPRFWIALIGIDGDSALAPFG